MTRDEILNQSIRAPVGEGSKTVPVTYFVQGEHGGPIKIGRTTEGGLRTRLANLQTGYSYPLVIRRLLVGDYEKELHEQFASSRLQGEWFEASSELLGLISVDIDLFAWAIGTLR